MPEKPVAEVSYAFGDIQTVYTNATPNVLTITNEKGEEVPAITSDLNVGPHTFTSTLKAGFCWADGSTTASVATKVTITKPTLTVQSLTIEGWQEKDMPNDPVLVIVNNVGTVITLPEENVKFKYRKSGETAWSEAKTKADWAAFVASLAKGNYEVTADIIGTDDFDPPASIPTATLEIWGAESVVLGLGYSATITLTAELKTDPLTIRLAEGEPSFFSYRQVQPDGSDLRFTDMSGNLLWMKIEKWDPSGESLIRVQAPNAVAGGQFKMCWGQLVNAETGEGIPLPLIPAMTVRPPVYSQEPLYHFAFQNSAENTGTQEPKTLNNDSTTATYANTGLPAKETDRAMTGWKGHSNSVLTLPTAYEIQCVVKTSTESTTYAKIIWAIGTRDGGGFALASNTSGDISLVTWPSNKARTVLVTKNISDATSAYHTYCVRIDGTTAELIIDGLSCGKGTINAPSTKHIQFGSIHGGLGSTQLNSSTKYYVSDWSIAVSEVSTVKFDRFVTANACFKNRWVTEPLMPDEWGTGEEPEKKACKGDPAYGEAFFTITDLRGNVITNGFPSEAGEYTLAVTVLAGRDTLKSWPGLPMVGPKNVKVTEHRPTSDLNGTEGSATRAGRVLLVNNYDDGTQKITDQEYNNLSGEVRWVHENDLTATRFPNLKAGVKHRLVATNEINELCGSSNIWTLTDAYIGNTRDGTGVLAEGKLPVYLPMTDKNQTHIVLRNLENASIESAFYTNGIGTIYFDVVNGSQDSTGAAYQFKVEIATNFEDGEYYFEWRELKMYPLLKDGEEPFVAQPATSHFSPNMQEEYSETRFYRVYVPVNERGPVAFRIVRETMTSDFADDQGGFLLFDNIVVSYPASRVDLTTYGLYDEGKIGEAVLGYEGAWSVSFPSKNDELYPRAKAMYSTSPISTVPPRINSATLHYRWRYLDQDVKSWQTASLDKTDLTSITALELPAGRVGDIEFWYDLDATAPYYKYFDYSGLGYPIDKSYYTEEIAAVTNRLNSTAVLPSRGTDWFVRQREGKSESESFRAVVERADGSAPYATVEFTLVEDHLWCGYLKTTDPVEGGLRFRLEERVPTSTAPEFVLATNLWKVASDIKEIPASSLYKEGGADEWNTLVCDATTGYLKFQLDDSTKALTVTHADRQNFNTWNDAHRKTFVGNSTEDEGKSGVSARMKDYNEDFANWTDTPATNKFWIEGFNDGTGRFTGWSGYNVFEPFPNAATPNGWQAGAGMWVNETFKVTTASGAFQMKGSGEGYLEYTGAQADSDPRGLESITYRARLAQTIEFDDMLYNDSYGKDLPTNYTFGVSALMSDQEWIGTAGVDDFDGAGQLSIVACYRPQKGCYEFRLTRTNIRHLKVELYKWQPMNGTMSATLLGASDEIQVAQSSVSGMPTVKYKAKATDTSWRYGFMYISVDKQTDGSKRIQAGFLQSGTGSRDGEPAADAKYMNLCYCDTKALGDGTYGLASANCPAIFSRPRTWSEPTKWLGDTTTKDKIQVKTNTAITLPTVTRFYEQSSVEGGWWAVKDGRYEVLSDENGYRWGFKATTVPQKVVLQSTDAKGNWVDLVTDTVTGFTLSAPIVHNFYRTGNARYRLRHGGVYTDARNDVVVDQVEIRQWGGDDYGSVDTIEYRGDWSEYAYRTNFVFTSGWVSDHTVQLNAKRATESKPCSIRSPLMDGSEGVGKGLGMISFSYRNVDSHVKLLLQIATNNVGRTELKDLTSSFDGWVTVAEFPSTVLRSSPSQNYYLGYHGVSGVMRLVVDPEVVKAAALSNDPNYGRIDITGIMCRDEPSIDPSCWWGWNLHTVSDDRMIATVDDGTRMYLPDCDSRSVGMSLALNNSITKDVTPGEDDVYRQNMPFLQTPTLSNAVGEVTFRARKFDNGEQQAQVCLYGARTGEQTGDWKFLAHFNVTNTYYETYHYRSPGETYHAFRLCVYGVEGVEKGTQGEEELYPELKLSPVRVLLEDVVVSEAVYPTLGFRYVYPVRTGLSDHTLAPAVDETGRPNRDEQPLVGENWTVQAEIAVKQLPDELDLTRTPHVFFHWHIGESPWGYENWKDQGKTAELKPVAGEPMVYRGSLKEVPEAVVEEVESDAVVQYLAEVEYWDVKGDVHTNLLLQSEWTRPYWYNPVDLNAGQKDFSAFTLLGQIAPGRAWINEVNVYDGKTESYDFPGDSNQYIEIAVPSGQSLEGWHLEYVNNSMSETNRFCYFGTGTGLVTPMKKSNETNDYVFIVVQNPAARDAKTWEGEKRSDGTPIEIDGTWDDFDDGGGLLAHNGPIAIRLVRPNQVVEQEIAFEGYNSWAGWGGTDTLEAYVDQLNGNRSVTLAKYYPVGSESNNTTKVGLDGLSLNVITNTGAVTAEWSPERRQTPGWCNEGQIIPEGWAIYPNGAMLVVTAKVDPSGHIRQVIGNGEPTTESVRLSMMKGGAGTNITYVVDAWYELASITTNGLPMVLPAPASNVRGVRSYQLKGVGAGCSNNFPIVASAHFMNELVEKYGLDADNRYTPAVKAWLEGGQNFFGREFENPGEICLAEYRTLADNVVTNLTLTDMYWLDMDPTSSNWWFKAGVTSVKPTEKPVSPVKVMSALSANSITPPEEDKPGIVTKDQNIRVKVKMFMTNTVSGVAYSPYVLRGAEIGSTSYKHYTSGTGNWNAVTFKVTGDLQNGNPNRERWLPLRWFYFLPDMVTKKSASFDANHEAEIEVWDPFDRDRSVTTGAWYQDLGCPVFYSWAIDTRNVPMTTEPLKPNSTYE